MSETTQELLNELEHYGVKGMKWGVRKDRSSGGRGSSSTSKPKTPKHLRGEVVLEKKLKNGGSLVVRREPPGAFTKMLEKRIPGFSKMYENEHFFLLSNGKGEKVGSASFAQTGPKSLALEWIGVDKKHRRQGYAKATLEGVMSYAKDSGFERLELTATQMGAPLYQSLGFKQMEGSKSSGNRASDIAGDYEYVINEKSARHADAGLSLDVESLSTYIVKKVDASSELEMSDEAINNFLEHYGVKGMKWGVRKDRSRKSSTSKNSSTDSKKKKSKSKTKSSSGKTDVSKMSNEELKRQNERMRLEQEYKRLKKQGRPSSGPVVDYLSEMGERQLKRVANNAIDYGVDQLLKSAGIAVKKKKK